MLKWTVRNVLKFTVIYVERNNVWLKKNSETKVGEYLSCSTEIKTSQVTLTGDKFWDETLMKKSSGDDRWDKIRLFKQIFWYLILGYFIILRYYNSTNSINNEYHL